VKTRRPSRSLLAGGVLVVTLGACGAAAPPADELANELIDTLEADGVPLSDAVKDCMHGVVDEFTLTDEERQSTGASDLNDVADKAADGQAASQAVIDRFQAELTACNTGA
jgi:hypothetical protein